jgi:hypothetical protein
MPSEKSDDSVVSPKKKSGWNVLLCSTFQPLFIVLLE